MTICQNLIFSLLYSSILVSARWNISAECTLVCLISCVKSRRLMNDVNIVDYD